MRKLFGLAIVVLTLLSAASVYARSGDMFENEGAVFMNRPPVPSDRYYAYTSQADMFSSSPPFLTNRDMFRSPTPFSDPSYDMFDFVHPYANPGIEEHFSAHSRPAIDGPLFHRPDEP